MAGYDHRTAGLPESYAPRESGINLMHPNNPHLPGCFFYACFPPHPRSACHSMGMADELISFPFRLTKQGAVAGVPYGSDQEVEEAIAVASMTEVGERPLFPNFGIPAPAFNGISAEDIQLVLDDYGPTEVRITGIVEEPANETESLVTISWEREDDTEVEDEL